MLLFLFDDRRHKMEGLVVCRENHSVRFWMLSWLPPSPASHAWKKKWVDWCMCLCVCVHVYVCCIVVYMRVLHSCILCVLQLHFVCVWLLCACVCVLYSNLCACVSTILLVQLVCLNGGEWCDKNVFQEIDSLVRYVRKRCCHDMDRNC